MVVASCSSCSVTMRPKRSDFGSAKTHCDVSASWTGASPRIIAMLFACCLKPSNSRRLNGSKAYTAADRWAGKAVFLLKTVCLLTLRSRTSRSKSGVAATHLPALSFVNNSRWCSVNPLGSPAKWSNIWGSGTSREQSSAIPTFSYLFPVTMVSKDPSWPAGPRVRLAQFGRPQIPLSSILRCRRSHSWNRWHEIPT